MSLVKAKELLKIAMLATRRSGVTLQDIRREQSCSHRTAQRWTDALEEVFPQVEIEVDEDRQRRWIIPARHVAPLLTPSGEELAALGTAIGELERGDLPGQASLLRELRAKVRSLTPATGRARREVDEEILLQALGHAARPGPRPQTDTSMDAALVEAFKGPFLVRMRYLGREGGSSVRTVAPYGMLLGVRRYLVAKDVEKGAKAPLQHFRVESISDIEVLDDTFEQDADFDLRKHAEIGFGSYVDERKVVDVVWRFDAEAAPRAERFMFHPTQTFEREREGSLLVRFRACGVMEMCWFLYQWGEHVEVLQPAELREMVHSSRRPFQALP
ncbi:helix-turn-helix transcriptional regulator [Qipengyuania profunda]|jgi:predicted DNA-binding transcriptional regulator YafY|uniref:helix-turn-helix transcriptional regulator n=1 Tax=Qipengyuania profunda TaxID=3113984 RepID=UPI002A188901|nr:WYL domain-containing protein [Qipengyuania sp. HL-TH1]WPL57916.1 WYL domain-containing protein [Qipengyuania sp. HL-TH5]